MTDKPKTIADMPLRQQFATPELGLEYLNKAQQEYTDFDSVPLACVGVDSDGNLDPAIFNADTVTVVSVLQEKRPKAQGGQRPKAVVVYAAPTLAALQLTAAGLAWIQKIVSKELNHVAVRQLRQADDVMLMIDQIPVTIEGFITATRESTGGLMESFNLIYRKVSLFMASKRDAWKRAAISKGELQKCFESRGYALTYYPALEDRPVSLFVNALQMCIKVAAKDGIDSTIFERWIDTRNAKTYSAADNDESDDDFDLDELLEVEPAATPTVEVVSTDSPTSEDEPTAPLVAEDEPTE